MTPYERPNRSTAEPNAWWQRVLAGERLPKRLSRHPKCEGTVEDHRAIALDVRELIRHRVFERRVGSEFNLTLAYPWLRVMRLNSSSLDLQLVTGRTVVVGLGTLWCHGRAEATRVPAMCPARLHGLPSPRQSCVSALSWPLVCRTAHQQLRPKSSGQAENPPQAWRLRSTLVG